MEWQGVKWQHLTGKNKESMINGQESRSRNQNSLSHEDLWHWLRDYSVPRVKSGGQHRSRKALSVGQQI